MKGRFGKDIKTMATTCALDSKLEAVAGRTEAASRVFVLVGGADSRGFIGWRQFLHQLNCEDAEMWGGGQPAPTGGTADKRGPQTGHLTL